MVKELTSGTVNISKVKLVKSAATKEEVPGIVTAERVIYSPTSNP
jgi:hypothetical protein